MAFFDDVAVSVKDAVQSYRDTQKQNDEVAQVLNGIDIYNKNRQNLGGIREDAYNSLRSGEPITYEDSNGKMSSIDGRAGMRYLGESIGDVLSPEYFSGKNVSNAQEPLQISMSDWTVLAPNGTPTPVGDFTVYYDDNGAISQIVADSDIYFKNGAKYKNGTKISGPGNLSQFFNAMGLVQSDSDYLIKNKNQNGRFGAGTVFHYGGNSKYWSPVSVFGSRGDFSKDRTARNIPISEWKNWWGTEGNTNSAKAWQQYWSQQRQNMEQQGNFRSGNK